MAIILNIDTSSKHCSVSIAKEGEIIFGMESKSEMDHSSTLAPFVEKGMNIIKKEGLKLDAVGVVIGPGSYTGLRIGLSLAKGLAFSLSIPLIILSSLEIMAIRAMFVDHNLQGNEIIVAMMDAGRMEVYAGVYDLYLKKIKEEEPVILEKSTFDFLKDKERVLFVGDGSLKYKEIYPYENAVWIGGLMPHAKYMATLSELKFRNNNFADLAYVTPRYLKEYKAIKSSYKW